MRVLFVSSGNNKFGINPFIKDQGDSLSRVGIKVDYFSIIGKGVFGYLKASRTLRKHLRNHDVNIIHAHYTLSGWVAVLAFNSKPIVLSLMGSDVYGAYIGENKIKISSLYLKILTKMIQPFVKSIICKSRNIERYVYVKNRSYIIPNGVNLDIIKDNRISYRDELLLDRSKKYILFLGSKTNVRKNYQLAYSAYKLLNNEDTELIAPYPVPHEQVLKYLNAVDCLLVTSFMEGSPNIVKEAMACNCPIVSTDVGDVHWLFGDEPGYYIADFRPEDFAEKLKSALEYSSRFVRTKGRERIRSLCLDAETIARRLIEVYDEVKEGYAGYYRPDPN
jgi:teichuronic acid biosynthesis glycosyltransferase TuaC